MHTEYSIELRHKHPIAVRLARDQVQMSAARDLPAIRSILHPSDNILNIRVVAPNLDVVTIGFENTRILAFVLDQCTVGGSRLEDARRHRVDHDFPVDVREESALYLFVRGFRMETEIPLTALPDLPTEVHHTRPTGRTEHTP